jgi:Fic family protein
MAQGWHREMYRSVNVPVSYYVGEIRDSDPRLPELFGHEVAVGPNPGVPSGHVPAQLAKFEGFMAEAVARLDAVVSVGEAPTEAGTLHSVLTLCAVSHGEWVRIHPFANGNGRTARLWANWCAVRYGLPPFVRLRPRPEGEAYAKAASDSMRGDHRATVIVFADLLTVRLGP